MSERGLIFNIQKFSLHDGSGIRTLVFLKGCPLDCLWCSNPEGRSYAPDLSFDAAKCIGIEQCGRCLPACPPGAISAAADKAILDRRLCDACGECVDSCPAQALELLGKWMSVEEVLAAVEEDSCFYARSGGGLTLSGGEPLAQAEFAARLLATARSRGIDTAVETSGLAAWEDLEAVCMHADHVFYDIKTLDRDKHREGTRVDNRAILSNLARLAETFPAQSITVRTPVIPGYNDSAEVIAAIKEFIASMRGDIRYELLPYHRFAQSKYERLARAYPLADLSPPSEQMMQSLRARA